MLISGYEEIKHGRMNYLFIGKHWSNGLHILYADQAQDSSVISK